jgi:HD-GYP domain-containing protein (c-di-GMP phosphodiesterase class II)
MSTQKKGANTRHLGEVHILASQLRPGVHVRLPGSWLDHQFMLSSFVIANEDQARQIAALNLPDLFCNTALCKVPPLPEPPSAPPVPDAARLAEDARLAALAQANMAAKVERTKVMTELRGRLDQAQKKFVGASKAVGGALKSFDQNPKESVHQVSLVSAGSATSLLADPDSVIVLIAEKGQDDGPTAHALSVMTLALLLGKQARLPEAALSTLGIGALLHDIGKRWLNPSILRNTERNRHEETVYATHCQMGYEALHKLGSVSPPVLEAVLHHHERFDGSGFPNQLKGDEIHIAARVVGIADRFDKLTNPIDHRRAVSPSEALSIMWTKEKSAYDPVLLQLFVRAMGVYPPGSIVQLSNGRVGAVVISAPIESPLCPQVLIYEPEIPRHQAIILNLSMETELRIEKPLRIQDRPSDELDYLLPRRKMNWFHSDKS